jgi:hypothetical protein
MVLVYIAREIRWIQRLEEKTDLPIYLILLGLSCIFIEARVRIRVLASLLYVLRDDGCSFVNDS